MDPAPTLMIVEQHGVPSVTFAQHIMAESPIAIARIVMRGRDTSNVMQYLQAPLKTEELLQVALWSVKAAICQIDHSPEDDTDAARSVMRRIQRELNQ